MIPCYFTMHQTTFSCIIIVLIKRPVATEITYCAFKFIFLNERQSNTGAVMAAVASCRVGDRNTEMKMKVRKAKAEQCENYGLIYKQSIHKLTHLYLKFCSCDWCQVFPSLKPTDIIGEVMPLLVML